MFVPSKPAFRPTWLRSPYTSTPDWLTGDRWVPGGEKDVYARASHGLSVTLREAVDSDSGADVLLPAYIPQSVVEAFQLNGYTLRFYPVTEQLRLPADEVASRITEHDPDIVLFVHYLGFADPAFDRLAALAKDQDALVAEDCARALFSRGRDGRLLGSTGDLSLYCLHKVLPVPNGGLLVSKETQLPTPTTTESEIRDMVANAVVRVGELCNINLCTLQSGFSVNVTRDQSVMEVDTLARPGHLTSIGLRSVSPAEIVEKRGLLYDTLYSVLEQAAGIDIVTPARYEGACPYGIGIRMIADDMNRDTIYRRLVAKGLPAESYTWDLPRESYTPSNFEGASKLRNQLLTIPTHQQISAGQKDWMIETVKSVFDLDGT